MKDQRILRIALGNGPSTISLDPRIGGDLPSGNILRLVFEGLTRFNQHGDIENALAESIEVSPNMLQYVFKLRPSLWNDGSSVTAYDFEYAWKKILSPNFNTSFAYFFYPIKNAKEAKQGKISLDQVGIHVINDHKLIIELNHPTPYFLQFMAQPLYSPVHRMTDKEHPEWPYQSEKNYLCNGPFQLKISQPNQGYQLIKNPFYWEANQIILDQIILTEMNSVQALQAFQKNEIDWIGNPFGAWHAHYNNQKDGNVISFSNGKVGWCVFNTAYGPFHNRKLRQAFAYAIERLNIIKSLDPLKPAYSLLPPHLNSQTRFPDRDVQKAKQLLNEALQELHLRKEDISSFNLIFSNTGLPPTYIVPCLQQQFKECLDIDCNLVPIPWNELLGRMTKGDFQIGLMTWNFAVDDPIYTLNSFKFANDEINFAKWENPKFQHLVDLSEQEVNPFRRSSYLIKAEEILIKEMPAIPLYYEPHHALISKNLKVSTRKNPASSGSSLLARSFFKNES